MEPYATADELWAGALVFARVGAVVMLIPGVGEAYVPPRIRLSFALLLSLVFTPLVAPGLPPLPDQLSGVVGWMLRETLTGLALGILMRMTLSALGVAGEVVSLQTTLSFAQTANPLQAQPGTTLAAFLTLLGVTLIFATNLHHLFITAISDSYQLIAPQRPLLIQDFAATAVTTAAQAFKVGIQIAAPVMVFALIFNVASGLVGRVMPQFQIFFAAAPLNVLLGLSVFALSLGVGGMVFIEAYRRALAVFSGG
ncbi:flagellar biosynthetic protein FliR [Brevundimonas sp. 2R-24]|uniref:Flagellar biosynthetic protein FliR n=1 Tax=Peiella sedimenti TaxID=3061083 RepID=A0ABT8SKZ6_9CAUL|nr:flagellar biosynthetic protein FliR [Caulobacteraceae bacterium XZ-24]